MAGVRSSKEETERRVFTIQGWIINGVPDYLILKNICNQFKNKDDNFISRRQAKELLKKAYTAWQEDEQATIEQKRVMRIAELKQDIRNMKEEFKGTPKGMAVINAIKKEITKLEGLYIPKVSILRGDKDNPLIPDSFTFDEAKEKRLKALLEKASKLDV